MPSVNSHISFAAMADLESINTPDNSPPSRDFIRSTKRYAVHYTHNGETFNEAIRAYDFDDAESRCRALNLVLDGEIG